MFAAALGACPACEATEPSADPNASLPSSGAAATTQPGSASSTENVPAVTSDGQEPPLTTLGTATATSGEPASGVPSSVATEQGEVPSRPDPENDAEPDPAQADPSSTAIADSAAPEPPGDDAGVLSPSQPDSGVNPEPAELLPFGLVEMSPAPGSADVCPDPQLRLRFAAAPSLGNAGRFVVYAAADRNVAVASVDLSSMQTTRNGLVAVRPAVVEGSEIIVDLGSEAFGHGREWVVVLEGDGVRSPSGEVVNFGWDDGWTFTTRAAPAEAQGTLRVSPEGAADYCTVQAALDAAEPGSTIEIAPGRYLGTLRLTGKDDLSLRGAGPTETLLFGTNNESMNAGTRARPLFLAEDVEGLVIDGIGIQNRTPQGGSQAEALALLDCDRCTVSNAHIESLQDTLLWTGRIYARDCFIAGNVDYIWGSGTAFFERCEIHTRGRSGYILQSRNPSDVHGYVFVDSKLSADAGISGDLLARIEVDRFPASNVAFIDCEMGSHISREGWRITGEGDRSGLRFWEFQSRDASGALLDVSDRAPESRQLSEADAAMLREPAAVLGGWEPAR